MDLCQWNRRAVGSAVCDHHPNLGLRCSPFHHPDSEPAADHWRGLRFESAPFRKDLTSDNTLDVSNSRSLLHHVVIEGAGRGRFKGRANATSALETWCVPPRVEHLTVINSAYNGINVTQPNGPVTLTSVNATGNRGYGIFVNSTKGSVVVEKSSVVGNMADGIRYHFHDLRPETKQVDGVDVHDFCTYSTTYSQTYPFLMVAEQYQDSTVSR